MSELRAACEGRDVERDGWPSVSVVVPVRNEGPHLRRAVESILAQQYPVSFDICLAVAPSDDDTFDVARALSIANEQVAMVANPAGVTPAGLNAAIAATAGSIVVRVDGHAELSSGYIRRAVETMIATGAVNVGGMQTPMPETPFEEAVAAATTSWLGTGGASYRVGGRAEPVDTVYLGVFDRAAGDSVGWFDESLIRNQDYELNIRFRQAGGTVWFDPALSVGYRPRGTLRSLVKQYYEYGYWKAAVLRRHPESLRLRQAVPPVALVVAGLLIAGSALSRRVGVVVVMLVAAYTGMAAAAVRIRRVRAVFILLAVHISWPIGMMSGVVSSLVASARVGRRRDAPGS